MAYFTATDLRRIAGTITPTVAEARLRADSLRALTSFDVFLSHSSRDAQVIYGLRALLMAQGLTVYVDWITDPQLDRSRVSSSTAALLRERMRASRSLIYATSRAASQSRWMPWELGYFDAARGSDRVSILPIETSGSGTFDGEEYLGLYRTIEKSISLYGPRPYAVTPGKRTESLTSFVRGEARFEMGVRL